MTWVKNNFSLPPHYGIILSGISFKSARMRTANWLSTTLHLGCSFFVVNSSIRILTGPPITGGSRKHYFIKKFPLIFFIIHQEPSTRNPWKIVFLSNAIRHIFKLSLERMIKILTLNREEQNTFQSIAPGSNRIPDVQSR